MIMKPSQSFRSFRVHLCLSLALVYLAIHQTYTTTRGVDCVDGPSYRYNGTRNYTKSGIPCQRWDANYPQIPIYQPKGRIDHNYCRNPDKDFRGTWCYTTNSSQRWQHCDIPKCPDDSKVVWTNYDEDNKMSHILWMHADPEVVKTQTDPSGILNVSVLLFSSDSPSEFYALTGDYRRNILIYTDYRSEYIGIRDLSTNTTTKILHGMAHGIECLAYDWVTDNLYWTDSVFKWIMAADRTFQFYTPVYRTHRAAPYALALHSKLRILYFSTYMIGNSTIIMSDFAGGNATVILKHPYVVDVTGITIDYHEDKLYWVNYNGFGSLLYSSDLDGEGVQELAHKQSSLFWGVAAHRDFVYVTDVISQGVSGSSEKLHTVWLVAKEDKKTYRYKLKGKPRGITVLSSVDEIIHENVSHNGACGSNLIPACEHICLPQINKRRVCQCSLGYMKEGDNRCVTNKYFDDFLLVADAGQGKIFQVPFSYTSEQPSNYGVMEITGPKSRVSSAAVDTRTEEVFWSDKKHNTIKKSSIDGSVVQILSNSTYASYMLVDPCTRNIFFIDSETQSIKVMDLTGAYTKTLKKTILTLDQNTSIQMIAQDLNQKKLYWTDTKSTEGRGEVWRMNFDGTEQELVYNNLNWPLAVTVDNKNQRLYISESKTAMIYMQPLSRLRNITSTSHQSIAMQYDFQAHLPTFRPFTKEMKVLDDEVYFFDDGVFQMQKFNLALGPASMEVFGPTEFFDVTSLSLYSSSFDTESHECSDSLCSEDNDCEHICVTTGSNVTSVQRQCLCRDGYVMLEGSCIETKHINTLPTFGDTCPDDLTYDLESCADHVTPSWTEPSWKDDFTHTHELIVERPKLSVLRRGHHVIRYSATDEHNVTSLCTFTVTVRGAECGKLPSLPEHLKASKLHCGYNRGSKYTIVCKSPDHQLHYHGKRRDNLTNTCETLGEWQPFSDFGNITCVPKPTTPTPSQPSKLSETATKQSETSRQPHYKSGDTTHVLSNIVSFQHVPSTGAIIGGVAAAAVVLIGMFVFLFLLFRRKESPWLIKINFPKLWKRKDDSNLTTVAVDNDPLRDVRLLEDVEESKRPQSKENHPQFHDDVKDAKQHHSSQVISTNQHLLSDSRDLNKESHFDQSDCLNSALLRTD